MKRLLSMFISIALMATSVLCVDFSAAAADDDIPNHVTVQAECDGIWSRTDGKEKSFVKESDGLCCNPTSSVYNRNVKV